MSLTDYIEAAVIVEAWGRPNDINQTYVEKPVIIANLLHLINAKLPAELIEVVLDRLIEKQFAEVIKDELAGDFFRLDYSRLVDIREQTSSTDQSLVAKYNLIGNQFLQKALSNNELNPPNLDRPILEQPDGEIPAADRLVRIDDNSPVRDEIVGKLDELATIIQGHNDEEGKLADRERIIAELRAGQELLKAPSVRVKAVYSVLGAALAWLAAEFAGGLIGELAGLLLEALKPLLGL